MLQPVKSKLVTPGKKFPSRVYKMHVVEFPTQLWNAGISYVILIKSDSITDALPAILKSLGTTKKTHLRWCHCLE